MKREENREEVWTDGEAGDPVEVMIDTVVDQLKALKCENLSGAQKSDLLGLLLAASGALDEVTKKKTSPKVERENERTK